MATQTVGSGTEPAAHPGRGLSDARRWFDDHGVEARLYPSAGVDGLATAALLSRRAGGEVSFVDPFAGPLDTTAGAVIIDRGIAPVRTRAPVLFVDHHPGPAPVRATVLWDEHARAASLLGWRLIGSPEESGWLVGLGVLGDRGERGLADLKLPLGPLEPLRRLAALCRSAGRLRNGPLTAAFSVLREVASARDALQHPQIRPLERAHGQVEGLLRDAAATPPRLGSAAALLEIDVPARVEHQLALAWGRRLAPKPVVVLNRGWASSVICFAAAGPLPASLQGRLGAASTLPGLAGPVTLGAIESVAGMIAAGDGDALVSAVLTRRRPPG